MIFTKFPEINFFFDELLKWNRVHNLYSRKMTYDMLLKQFEESMNFSELISPYLNTNSKHVDLGSGNGLPGVITSILNNLNTTLTEPVFKKAQFLRHLSFSLNRNIKVHASKWQSLKERSFDIITSKAFSSLSNLLEAQDFVSRETNDGTGFYLKGEKYEEEIVKAEKIWDFSLEIKKNGGCGTWVLIVKNLRKREI